MRSRSCEGLSSARVVAHFPEIAQAATFYYEYDKNYAKALENINKATAENPKAFFLFLQKAKIQRDMGDKEGAKASAMKTVELAKEAKNADYENFGNEANDKVVLCRKSEV